MSLDVAGSRREAARALAGFSEGRIATVANGTWFVALFAFALLPTLVTPIPAMVDYVNHLARMYVLAGSGAPFYHLTSAFYPNLAMDLMVPRLAPLLGVELATRVFLLATQVSIITGAMAIEVVVKGRSSLSGYVALLSLYSVPFAWGFLNFEFALALALWGIAAWLKLRERHTALRLAVHAAFVGALLVSHLFALGLYGFTLGVHELWSARSRPLGATVRAIAMLAAPASLALVLMLRLGSPVGQAVNTWDLVFKPLWPFILLNGYSAIGSAIATSILILLLHALIKRRALAFRESGAWLSIGFAVLYVAVPGRLLDTAFVDIRVLAAAALILPAFVDLRPLDARMRRVALGLTSAIVLASVGFTTWVWLSYQADYRELIASFARLDMGAKVVVGGTGRAANPPILDLTAFPMHHAPTLAVHYAGAFVPTLFTTVGKQPIIVDPAYRRLAYSCGGPVATRILASVALGKPDADTPDFVRTWPRDFDYLYVVGDAEPNPVPDLLEEIQASRRFTLYRIRKTASR